MARPSYPQSVIWEEGPKKNYHQSTHSFHTSSPSNPMARHLSQLALQSHNPSPLDTLLSQPIEFIKTQTIPRTPTGNQTVSSFGYFNYGKIGRERNSVSVGDEAIKKMRGDTPAKNVDNRGVNGDKLLGQSQSLCESRVAGEVSIGKTTYEISTRMIGQPSSGKSSIPPREKQNKSNKELASEAPIKSKTSQPIGISLDPVPSEKGKEKNKLNEVPHLSKSGVHDCSFQVSTALPPDKTMPELVSEKMATLQLDSTKNQSKNLKLGDDLNANTNEKIFVPGRPDLKRKPEALSEQPSKRRQNGLRVKGLQNTSFFCYRNSVLQLLASSVIFVKEITKHSNEKCHCGPNCTSCALGQFLQNHFRPAGGRQALNSSLPLVHRLRNVLPTPFGRNQCNQEDASEYMLALLNKGVDQLNSAQKQANLEENHFDRVFGAKYDSVLTCPICNNRSVTPEYQLSLQLAPKVTPMSLINLKACFATNFAEEYVEASCEKCGYKTEPLKRPERFVKKTEIRRLPKFLVINLSRYRMGKSTQTKIMNPVKLEEMLVLKEGDRDVTYRLRGVIAHKGRQLRSGHYIAFIKQPDRTWAKCDDIWVTESSLEYIRRQQRVFQIYVLGYEQVTC